MTRMINKSYIRSESRELENPYGDWQMKLLNHPLQPDLIPDIYKYLGKIYTRGESEITLEQILLFLQANGIRKVIIFDYSSSNITDDYRIDIAKDERERRAISYRKERDMAFTNGTLGYGGKKTRRNKNSKIRRNKKRVVFMNKTRKASRMALRR